MLPNFLIIGSQKAGTTSLYHILKEHPQIYMPETKEVNFFFKDEEYARGLEAYAKHFTDSANQLARGEASPGYICHPEAPARIHALLPDIKLILTVRDPIKRAVSQYWDNRRHLNEPLTFAQALDAYLDDDYAPDKIGYFSRGVYMRYIRRYLEYFPRENLLILPFEEMLTDAESFYKKIFAFLDVDTDFESEDFDEAFNPTEVWKNLPYQMLLRRPRYQKKIPARLRRLFYWGRKMSFSAPPIDEASRQKLEEFYKPWNDELREFLGAELASWGQASLNRERGGASQNSDKVP
ncbi:MAG: sulfotransferase domain-containing protein [Chloroflexi bacterium]|nr:sulfotransferase domain-containing protein [Chloroflexota bacterium]